MTEHKNPNDILILILFERLDTDNNKEDKPIIEQPKNIAKYIDKEDKVFKAIMKQFVSNKKHIEAVKKIDTGDYTKEYFEENLPHYSPKLHEVLEKCSKKKTHDDKQVLAHKEGNFILDFS